MQLGRVGHVLDTREERLLLFPGLGGGAFDNRLLDRRPAGARLVGARERLARVKEPGVVVLEVRRDQRTMFDERLGVGRRGHESVVVLTQPLQVLTRRQSPVEYGDLLVGVHHSWPSRHHLLGRDEVLAEDVLRERIVGGGGGEAADALRHVSQKLATARQESLEAVEIETYLLDAFVQALHNEIPELPALIRRDRPLGRHRRLLSLGSEGRRTRTIFRVLMLAKD